MSKINHYADLTAKIIELLETQQLTWNKPWISLGSGQMASNAETNRVYSLINQILLGMACEKLEFEKNSWLTFKQIDRLGGSILKGKKASSIYFNTYIYFDKDNKKYSKEEVMEMSGPAKKELGIDSKYYLTSYKLFNVGQTKDLPESYYEIREQKIIDLDQYAEEIIESSGAIIKHEISDKAYYDKKTDSIHLPQLSSFKSASDYYEVIFHELAHWTGHKDRLARPGIVQRKTKERYANEELIAELCSAYICATLGVGKNISNNAAYIQSWLNALNEDPRYIMKVLYQANLASRLILQESK